MFKYIVWQEKNCWWILREQNHLSRWHKMGKREDQRRSLGENTSSSQSSGVVCWLWMLKEVGKDEEVMRRWRTVSVGFKCWFWSGNTMSWLSSCQSNIHREGCVLSSVLQGNWFSSIFCMKHSFAVLLPSHRLDKECQGGFKLIAN